ncbi:MAG: SLC13 family permease [Corticimicrobacter sp.]|uniref:SLC13 family permease n=1 Tax=Corticimicrobacter sp. TaxID=2678536 RepID=UPI0032DBE037
MMSLLVISAIVLAIALGYRTNINIGLFSIAFAYIIGCFVMGMKPGEVIALWPLKIFFVIFAVCLFYGFAIVNGTLERLSEHLLYSCRRFPHLLPYAIFLTATLIAALGAGYYTVLAFMAPLTLLLCEKTKMNLIIGGMSANYGALAGANFVSSQSGVIFRSLMGNAGVPEETAMLNSLGIFVSTMIIPLVVITIFVFFTGHRRAIASANFSIQKPEQLTREQKTTLLLTVAMMVLVLLPPVALLIAPDNATLRFVNSRVDIGLIASVFSVIALLLKLGNERKVMATVPWNTLLMICGVGMLISIAIKAGTIDLLASWIGTTIPTWLVPVAIGVIAATMSLFASTLGVVTPALFPIVPPIASSLSIDPMILFIAIVVGSQATSVSPFASGGSLLLGACPTDKGRAEMFPRLLFQAAPIGLAAAVIFNFILTFMA